MPQCTQAWRRSSSGISSPEKPPNRCKSASTATAIYDLQNVLDKANSAIRLDKPSEPAGIQHTRWIELLFERAHHINRRRRLTPDVDPLLKLRIAGNERNVFSNGFQCVSQAGERRLVQCVIGNVHANLAKARRRT